MLATIAHLFGVLDGIRSIEYRKDSNAVIEISMPACHTALSFIHHGLKFCARVYINETLYYHSVTSVRPVYIRSKTMVLMLKVGVNEHVLNTKELLIFQVYPTS